MGYRNYLGSIPKKEYNKIKKFTEEELYAYKNEDINEGYVGVYDFITEIYEFGKYCNFPTKGLVKSFFKNKELQNKMCEDSDLHIITKDFVKMTIDIYKERIIKYYDDMVLPFLVDDKKPSEFLNTIKSECTFTNGDLAHTFTFDFSKITPEQQTAFYKIYEHVRNFRNEWIPAYNVDSPYDLENGDSITTSWKYEYEIFELVRIYKHFDWKKNVMVYYGY